MRQLKQQGPGRTGKGFAVVAAEEVRKLAEQSVQSARQISGIIQEIQEETRKTVYAMGIATDDVSQGVSIAIEAGEMFEQIYASAQSVTGEIQEISVSSEQMSASTDEVTASIEEMEKIANDTAVHTRELTKISDAQMSVMDDLILSSDKLGQTVTELNQVVRRFKM